LREEEAEDLGEAFGPGGFVMGGVGDAEVAEIHVVAPATEQKAAVE
jgi:hypothetical protein